MDFEGVVNAMIHKKKHAFGDSLETVHNHWNISDPFPLTLQGWLVYVKWVCKFPISNGRVECDDFETEIHISEKRKTPSEKSSIHCVMFISGLYRFCCYSGIESFMKHMQQDMTNANIDGINLRTNIAEGHQNIFYDLKEKGMN